MDHLNCSLWTSAGLANLAVNFSRQIKQLNGFSTFLFRAIIQSAIFDSNLYNAFEFEQFRLFYSQRCPSPKRWVKLAKLNLSLKPSWIQDCVFLKDSCRCSISLSYAIFIISCWQRYQQLPTINLGQFLLTLALLILPCFIVLSFILCSALRNSFYSYILSNIINICSPPGSIQYRDVSGKLGHKIRVLKSLWSLLGIASRYRQKSYVNTEAKIHQNKNNPISCGMPSQGYKAV